MAVTIRLRVLLDDLVFMVIYSFGLYLVEGFVISKVFQPDVFWVPGAAVCGAVFLGGGLVVVVSELVFEREGVQRIALWGGAGGGGSVLIGISLILLLAAVISGAICAVFFLAHQNQDGEKALIFGFASALAWGLSVVGGLL